MSQTTFDQRVTNLEVKRRLSGGVTYRIGPDGMIVAQPHRRYAPRFPARGVLLLLGVGFAFKAALLVASGEAAYSARLDELAQGRAVEQGMAWLMQPDPATRGLASSVAMVARAIGAELR